MTPLPNLPSNLSTGTVASTVQASIPALPPIPGLPSIPGVPSVAQLASPIAGQVGQVTGQITAVTQNLQQLNVASESITALIDTAIPEETIEELIKKYTSLDGTVDFSAVRQEIDNKYKQLNDTYNKVINARQVPKVQFRSLLAALLPDIPTIDIPSPAEIQQRINAMIEKKKRIQQEAITKAQKLAEKIEESPFTAREDKENAEQNEVKSSCVVTEVGDTLELAVSKAENKLRRNQSCSGTTTILKSSQEGNRYTVTIKIQ